MTTPTSPVRALTPAEVFQSLTNLADQLKTLSGAMDTFEHDRVEREAAAARVNRRRFAAMTVVALVLLVGLTASLLAAFGGRALLHQWADCVNQDGKCYAQNAKRTGGILSELDRRHLLQSVFIVECSREATALKTEGAPQSGPAFDRAFEACVNKRLAARGATGLPAPPTGN